MDTLKESRKRLTDLVIPYFLSDGCLPESNEEINDASRGVIFAMHETNMEVWIGNVNLHRDSGKPELAMWKWDGSFVLNFGSAFVLPRHDETLERMILARADAPYTTTKDDYDRVSAITDRIREIGGEHLHWT